MDRFRGGMMGRGPLGGHGPGFDPRSQRENERRFKALEEKMDRILKQLDRRHDQDKTEKSPKKTEADSDV
jgi:hypothetical protein